MKFIYGTVFGFAIAAFYYTGTAGETYRSVMPAKTVEEQATDVWEQTQGHSKVRREFNYITKKIGLDF